MLLNSISLKQLDDSTVDRPNQVIPSDELRWMNLFYNRCLSREGILPSLLPEVEGVDRPRIDLGTIDLGTIDLGTIDLRAIDLRAVRPLNGKPVSREVAYYKR